MAWRSTPKLKKNLISKSYPCDVKNLLKEKRRLENGNELASRNIKT